MKCPNCGNEMIYGGDHDVQDPDEKHFIESNHACPHCSTNVLIYTPFELTL